MFPILIKLADTSLAEMLFQHQLKASISLCFDSLDSLFTSIFLYPHIVGLFINSTVFSIISRADSRRFFSLAKHLATQVSERVSESLGRGAELRECWRSEEREKELFISSSDVAAERFSFSFAFQCTSCAAQIVRRLGRVFIFPIARWQIKTTTTIAKNDDKLLQVLLPKIKFNLLTKNLLNLPQVVSR